MKYSLTIEGGFAGISRKYEGEATISSERKEKLFGLMQNADGKSDEHLRDGFVYHITMIEGNEQLQKVFDDASLPTELRSFIAEIESGSSL